MEHRCVFSSDALLGGALLAHGPLRGRILRQQGKGRFQDASLLGVIVGSAERRAAV